MKTVLHWRSCGKTIILRKFEIWAERKTMRKKTKKKKSGIICNIFQLLILPVFYHDLHRASYLFIFLPGLNLERQGMRVWQEYKMAHFSKFRVNR